MIILLSIIIFFFKPSKKPESHLSGFLVDPPGLEPGTTWLWVRCSNQLSYRSNFGVQYYYFFTLTTIIIFD